MKRSVVAVLAFVVAAGAAPRFALADKEPSPSGDFPGSSGAAASESAAGHGEHASGEHEEAEQEFNWAYGFLGEKEGVEPDLAYRPKGMAPPFLANVLNALVLFTIIVVAGRKPIALGLRKRKERIVHGMEEARSEE